MPTTSTFTLMLGAVLVIFGLGTAGYAITGLAAPSTEPAGPHEVLTASIAPTPAGPSRGTAASSSPPVPSQNAAGRPKWINIPRIGVDTSVIEVGI